MIRVPAGTVKQSDHGEIDMLTSVSNAYAAVMDPNVNPLRRLPKVVRFQVMTSLALMWSTVFCVWMGAAQLVGWSWGAHAILLIGIYFTTDIFHRASKPSVVKAPATRPTP